MALPSKLPQLLDSKNRVTALTDFKRTLLVEAGAGSGKTALLAGRIVMLILSGIEPREIVAITFTNPGAAELLQRVQEYIDDLLNGKPLLIFQSVLPNGLSDIERQFLESKYGSLNEITCTTIHGFCQQLIRPYAVENQSDPGASIAARDSAKMACKDLIHNWLSEMFGRKNGGAPSKDKAEFITELARRDPRKTVALVEKVALFLMEHRNAKLPTTKLKDTGVVHFQKTVEAFAKWYSKCGIIEATTTELIADLKRVMESTKKLRHAQTPESLAELVFHEPPTAYRPDENDFKAWRRKAKWGDAAIKNGKKKTTGEELSKIAEGLYLACGLGYGSICNSIGALAAQYLIPEIEPLKDLFQKHKKASALLDFDDLLYLARDLLRNHEGVRKSLAERYPKILVDEFQDTDPIQAEILWLLAGEGTSTQWWERKIRPGALFLVGDPKQAIYRFRGADIGTYEMAKLSLQKFDKKVVIEITANFRTRPPILDFVNKTFSSLLSKAENQPGFTALQSTRPAGNEACVQHFPVFLEKRFKVDDEDKERKPSIDEVRTAEAEALAETLAGLIGIYPIKDDAGKFIRYAKPGDIALLVPVKTNLWIYEYALEVKGIPLATQAGKGFYGRQEVQDMLAMTRAIANREDTLALGAFLRGPLVGMTEEELADAIHDLNTNHGFSSLSITMDAKKVEHPILRGTLEALKALSLKANSTSPYLLLAEAVNVFQVLPKLKARHPMGAERAIANVDLVLEMSRPFSIMGLAEFALDFSSRWADSENQEEGRPDEDEGSVKIITMHSSKGLEWPIVIPINSTTTLDTKQGKLFECRPEQTLHLEILEYPSPGYNAAKEKDAAEIRNERVRLWYVALTRAKDLLLLPKQNIYLENTWYSLLQADLFKLPEFKIKKNKDKMKPAAGQENTPVILLDKQPPKKSVLSKDSGATSWESQAEEFEVKMPTIQWHRASAHDEKTDSLENSGWAEVGKGRLDKGTVLGSRERGEILHKLMEEVLNGETAEELGRIVLRAGELIVELGFMETKDASKGLSSQELGARVVRTLELAEVKALRGRLVPEVCVYENQGAGSAGTEGMAKWSLELMVGVADAVARGEDGRIEVVVDWKSDVAPAVEDLRQYKRQVGDYARAVGAKQGLVVLMSEGRVEWVK